MCNLVRDELRGDPLVGHHQRQTFDHGLWPCCRISRGPKHIRRPRQVRPEWVQIRTSAEACSCAAGLRLFVDEIGRLEVRTVLLLVEGLAVKGARRCGDAGQDGQSQKSR
jgi:hypothetical protein